MNKRNARTLLLMTAILLAWIVHLAMVQCTESPQRAAMLHPDNPFPPMTNEHDSLQPYIDPRERRPMVIRKTWLAPIMMKIRAEHMATFQKYPAKKPIVDLR